MHLHLVIANAAQVCWHLATDLLYNKPASGYVRRGLCRRICCKLSTDVISQSCARSLCLEALASLTDLLQVASTGRVARSLHFWGQIFNNALCFSLYLPFVFFVYLTALMTIWPQKCSDLATLSTGCLSKSTNGSSTNATNLILTHPLQLVATLLQVCCNLFASCCKSVEFTTCNKSVAFWLRISWASEWSLFILCALNCRQLLPFFLPWQNT